ncbi:hypothetical protein SAMN04489737_1549 [Arcanobacterium phocae]|uniref:PKD domain-containing protein n=1 Tax=Arcanobacterium phocae TaxID=131112 RepID=A0A1H2LL50_9ACTO|nr:hypothetical protein [Arcanobacterium phocae]SDU81554.1 hypothetical protein SAMN04489737_1549 [Arcanobacterium phocae]
MFGLLAYQWILIGLFRAGGDIWSSSADGNAVTIHATREFVLPSVVQGVTEGMPRNGSTLTFPDPTYTMADFCANKPIPSTMHIGQGLGNVIELEKHRKALCDTEKSSDLDIADIAQAVHDQASTIIDHGDLEIQPSGSEVLVNKDVYFLSTAHEHHSSVTVGGHQIDVHLIPQMYKWNFGDGKLMDTLSPGGMWPDGDVQHSYKYGGYVQPDVTVVWKVEAQLPSGAWIKVPGDAETKAIGKELTVVEAHSALTYRSR